MEAFLPSEIGRLIYGYLFQQCGEDLANEFLDTCDVMEECRLFKQKYSKNFHSKVQDLSLENILDQYSVLCSMIFQNTVDEEPLHRNILNLLKKLLNNKLGSLDSCHDEDVVKKVEVSNKSSPRLESREQNDSAIDELSIFSLSASDTENITPADRVVESPLEHGNVFVKLMGASQTVFDSTENISENIAATSDYKLPASVGKSSSSAKSKRECKKKEKLPSTSNRSNLKPEKNSAKPVVDNGMTKLVNTNSQIIDITEDLTAVKLTNCVSESRSSRDECSSNKTSFKVQPVAELKQKEKKNLRSITRKNEKVNKNVEKLPVKEKAATNLDRLSEKTSSFVRQTDVLEITPSTASEIVTTATNVTEVPKVTDAEVIKMNTADTSVTETTTKIYTAANVTEVPIMSTAVNNETTIPVTDTFVACMTEVSILSSVAENTEKVSTVNSKVLEKPEIISSVRSSSSVNETVITPTLENVFGDLSFASDCSQPSKLDESASSVKSAKEINETDEPNSSELKATLHESLATFSETLKTPAESETALSSPNEDDLPWDLKLRKFISNDSSVDAHVTKRKPRDLRCKKRKETPKKRKLNEFCDENPTNAKRVKSDAVLSRSKSTAAELAEIGNINSSKLNSSRRRRRSSLVDTSISCENDNKKDTVRKTRSRMETKAAENTNEPLKAISMNDIIDFSEPVVEKKKKVEEKVAFSEKQNIIDKTNAAPEDSSQKNSVVKKSTPVIEDLVELDESTIEKTKSCSVVEETTATEKSKQDVNNETQVIFKEPNPPTSKSSIFTQVEKSSCVNIHPRPVEVQKCDGSKSEEILKERQTSADNKRDECDDSRYDDDSDFEMVLEISSEFVLYSRTSQC